MKRQPSKALLAVLLTAGLAGQAAAQTSSEARHVIQPRGQMRTTERSHPGSVKITESPSEETTVAQAPPSETPMAQPAAPSPGGQVREEVGISAARDWLALVDSGNYAGAYDQAGELFRGSTPREQWQAGLENSRRAVGSLMERHLKNAVVSINLPNAPQGEYVTTTFETKFQQTQQPVPEIVTAYLTANGWKVVGYLIKPANGAPASGGGGQGQSQRQAPAR